MNDRSRRPHRSPKATPGSTVEALVKERREYPEWGARKIGKRVSARGLAVPAERTVNRIFARHGLVSKRGKAEVECQRFERREPNQLWQFDYKGPLRGAWGIRSVPFVVEDDASRYLLGLWSLSDKTLASTWPRLWDLFGAFGLPQAMLSDNDSVFGGRCGPSQLEVKLMRLGITILHGRAYHPQTQGKVERLNGTLQRELLRHRHFLCASDLQVEFDRFRHRYNFERPHDALALQVPGKLYRPSLRPRPKALPEVEYSTGAILRKVDSNGDICWQGDKIDVGNGLIKEWVEVREEAEGIDLYYGRYLIMKRDWEGNCKRLRCYRGEGKQ